VASDRYDYVFWFGDLNYRVNGTRAMVENLIKGERMEVLLGNDQLYHEMKLGRAFAGFWESEIDFSPTIKYDVGTDRYDTAI
jgi:hypothetical protein